MLASFANGALTFDLIKRATSYLHHDSISFDIMAPSQDALDVGGYCRDTQPDELVFDAPGNLGSHPRSDQVEFIFDGNLD